MNRKESFFVESMIVFIVGGIFVYFILNKKDCEKYRDFVNLGVEKNIRNWYVICE